MIIYIVVFILSLLFISMGLNLEKKSLILSKIFIVVGLLFPCFLAANRSLEIGTDTKGYVYNLFELSRKSSNLSEFYDIAKKWYMITDRLYLLLTFLIAHLFGNFRCFLFVVEFLVIYPIYRTLNINKTTRNDVLIGMTLFYLFEYNVSFNMVRQCLGISFVILMIHYLIHNNRFKSIIYLLIAIGFHSTSVICILFFPIYKLFIKTPNEFKNRRITKFLIYMLILLIVVLFEKIIYLLNELGIYSHGIVFLKTYATTFDLSFIDTITYFIPLYVYIKNSKLNNSDIRKEDFKKFLGYGSLIFLLLGCKIQYLERISFYLFYPFLLYIFPLSFANNYSDNSNKKGINNNLLFVIFYFIIYWYINFVVLDVHNTVPFIFD